MIVGSVFVGLAVLAIAIAFFFRDALKCFFEECVSPDLRGHALEERFRLLRRLGATALVVANFWVAAAAARYAYLSYQFDKEDHEPKPHLDLVFENRTEQLTTYGPDEGDGLRDIKINLVLRNQGEIAATGVVVHLFIDDVLDDATITDPSSRVVFRPINGLPPSYEAVINWGNLAPNVPEQIGPIEFYLREKSYTITTEIDCCDNETRVTSDMTLSVQRP